MQGTMSKKKSKHIRNLFKKIQMEKWWESHIKSQNSHLNYLGLQNNIHTIRLVLPNTEKLKSHFGSLRFFEKHLKIEYWCNSYCYELLLKMHGWNSLQKYVSNFRQLCNIWHRYPHLCKQFWLFEPIKHTHINELGYCRLNLIGPKSDLL